MRYRRFYKLLIPYLALLYIILFAASGIIYNSFSNTLTQEVEKSQLSMTRSTQKYLNGQMTAFTRIALAIDSNGQFEPHQLNAGGYNSYLAQQELVKLKAGNDILSDIVYYPLYKNDSDLIYSTISSSDFDLFFGSLCRVQGMPPEKMRKFLEQLDSPTLLPLQNVSTNSRDEKYLLYFYPYKSGNRNSSVAIFFIQNSSLETQIGNILSGNSGYVYILDQNGSTITSISYGSHDISTPEMLRHVQSENIQTDSSRIQVSGEDFFLNRLTAPDNGWTYLVVTDSRPFMEKVYSSRMFFNVILFALGFLGSSGAFFIALRNYLPLRALAAPIRTSQPSLPPDELSDEIDCISSYIRCLSHQNLNYELRHSLQDVMLGRPVGRAAVQKQMEQADFLPAAHYRALVFFRDSVEPGEQSAPDFPDFLERMAAQSGIPKAFCFEYADSRSFPVLLCYDGDADSPCVGEFIDSVTRILNSRVTFTVGIGAPFSDIFEVSESLRQASAAIYYRVIRGKNSVIDYRNIQTARKQYVYPFEYEQKLTRAIKQAKTEEIAPTMRQIAAYIESNAGSPDLARCICIGVAYAVVHTLEEIRVDINAFDSDENYLYPKPYEPVDQFSARVCNLCERVCLFINRHKESRNDELAQNAAQFVRAHFSDNTLSLDVVADYCGISASYLSRFFKEQFGESVVQFIDSLRMERAKELLSGTDRSLKDITAESGYGSETNFIRKFKKKEGITPMQYRELSRSPRTDLSVEKKQA